MKTSVAYECPMKLLSLDGLVNQKSPSNKTWSYMTITVRIKLLDEALGSELPFYATKQSAGVDLRAVIESDITMSPGDITLVPTGVAIALPVGTEAQIRPRSGLAAKNGITVLNSPGTIDSDYRGEIKVILINHGKENFVISNGMRIAQMIFAKHETAEFELTDDLDDTERGVEGFGSTGIK
jgi:dUTP pyrophosphatase